MVKPTERRGFQTPVWGPAAWVFLHTITFSYPDKPSSEMKRTFKNFFKSLCSMLPCVYCRQSYSKYCMTKGGPLALTSEVLSSRKSLTTWLYKIHDAVNERLEKEDRPSYDAVKKMYTSFEAQCSSKKNKIKHGCIVPVNGNRKMRTVIRFIPRECRIKGKTLKILRSCKSNAI